MELFDGINVVGNQQPGFFGNISHLFYLGMVCVIPLPIFGEYTEQVAVVQIQPAEPAFSALCREASPVTNSGGTGASLVINSVVHFSVGRFSGPGNTGRGLPIDIDGLWNMRFSG